MAETMTKARELSTFRHYAAQRVVNQTAGHPLTQSKMTYHDALKSQAQLLANVITGQADAYYALMIR